jgi:hypothetical protein
MDPSSDGILPPPRHDTSLITTLPGLGDIPSAPILISSDSDSPQILQTPAGMGHAISEAASPKLGKVAGVHMPSLEQDIPSLPSIKGECSSEESPFDSVSSYGRDAAHPLELSSGTPSQLSSYHSSQAPDVPDMGSA